MRHDPALRTTGRRSHLLFLAAILALATPGFAETDPQAEYKLPFLVGESLTYHAYWGVFHVANTEVTTAWETNEGKRVIAIRYRTRGTSFIDTIYPVDDTIESLIDPATMLPLRFEKKLSEGRHRAHEITVFDHAAGKAYVHNVRKDKRETIDIPPDIRDLVSFMYNMRGQDFVVGQESRHQVMTDEKIYDLWLKVEGKDEMKFDRYGKIRNIRIEPKAAFQGLFVRKGKLTIWVSDDPRRICTRIMATIPVANIRINLVEVRGPGDDFWVKPKKDKAKEK